MVIREINSNDVDQLMALYMKHLTKYPPKEAQVRADWIKMIHDLRANDNYHLLVGSVDDLIVASVTIIIIPNLTHNNRPYAVMENIVTHQDYRNCGYASQMMTYASKIAEEKKCYKIMLMTGSKRASTLHFYEKNGFTINEKTACLKRL